VWKAQGVLPDFDRDLAVRSFDVLQGVIPEENKVNPQSAQQSAGEGRMQKGRHFN
jgi:hypothetical protein